MLKLTKLTPPVLLIRFFSGPTHERQPVMFRMIDVQTFKLNFI